MEYVKERRARRNILWGDCDVRLLNRELVGETPVLNSMRHHPGTMCTTMQLLNRETVGETPVLNSMRHQPGPLGVQHLTAAGVTACGTTRVSCVFDI